MQLNRINIAVALVVLRASPATGIGTLCNVLDWGAKGDNVTDDTAAVSSCLAASDCETVLLPLGHTFLLKPVRLRSNTHLRIEGDIQAWPDVDTWPNSTVRYCPVTPYQSKIAVVVPKKESLLWAHNSTSITVSGCGVVHGSGQLWWPLWNTLNAASQSQIIFFQNGAKSGFEMCFGLGCWGQNT